MNASSIKILLVEDDELFRLGLVTRLSKESDLEIIAEAEDGESAIALVSKQVFDVVILDVALPGIGGIEACRQIKQKQPHLPILALTSHSQSSLITQLIEAGAKGYCVKGLVAENLLLAIRSVAAGASWWDETASKEIQSAFEQTKTTTGLESASSPINPLTQREQEILGLIAKGCTNQEIAETLYITPGTVRVHVHAILHKLEVRDRTQAAILALNQGLIS